MNLRMMGILVLRVLGLFSLYQAVRAGIPDTVFLITSARAQTHVDAMFAGQMWRIVLTSFVAPFIFGFLLVYGAPLISRWLFGSGERVDIGGLTEGGLGVLAFQTVGLFVLITHAGPMFLHLFELVLVKAGGRSPFLPAEGWGVPPEGYEGQLMEKLFSHLLPTAFGAFVLLRARWLSQKLNVESGKEE